MQRFRVHQRARLGALLVVVRPVRDRVLGSPQPRLPGHPGDGREPDQPRPVRDRARHDELLVQHDGGARPDYALYTGVLDHLGTEAFPATLPGLDRTVYGIDTLDPQDHDREDLLVMNDNITHAISFSPSSRVRSEVRRSRRGAGTGRFTRHGRTTRPGWNRTRRQPVPQDFPRACPETYTLPPQSLVLFESYPSGGSYVRVLNTGVPNGTAWYANVAGEFYSTTANNISLLLPPGAYPVASVPIPLPIDGREVHPSEQLAPFVASPIDVDGASTNVTLSFVDQWRLNVSAAPGDAGSVTPDVGWWNSSEPVTLTATPLVGYAFAGWSGWGPGSANGIEPLDHDRPDRTGLREGAVRRRRRGRTLGVRPPERDPVVGHGPGVHHHVDEYHARRLRTVRFVRIHRRPGTGYRTFPANGGFTVDSSWSLVEVRFVLITPPPPVVPVTFRVSGLPAATPVAITVRNSTETAGADGAVFRLANGSYAYHVGYVAGYHADVAEKTFDVLGGGLTVDVPFVPTTYPVTWQAAGTRTGLNWTVRVDGQPDPATTAWLSTSLPNGSYAYAIELPSNYSATPRTGVVVVHGFSAVLPVTFSLLEFRAWFDVSGAPASTDWSIRFGNLTHAGASNGSSFLAANGTYTFDVDPPAGYFAVPSHGTLDRRGPRPPDGDPIPPDLEPAVGGPGGGPQLGRPLDVDLDRALGLRRVRGRPRASTPGRWAPLTAGTWHGRRGAAPTGR